MSRDFVVTKRRRIPYRSATTPAGEKLDAHCLPMNPVRGVADVAYEGAPVIERPADEHITISNRSGDRKKI